jgi:hypothetical protein
MRLFELAEEKESHSWKDELCCVSLPLARNNMSMIVMIYPGNILTNERLARTLSGKLFSSPKLSLDYRKLLMLTLLASLNIESVVSFPLQTC